MHRKAKIMKIRRFRRIRFYLLIILVISLGVFTFKSLASNRNKNQAAEMESLTKEEVIKKSQATVPKKDHKDLGEIESIIEYGNNGLVGVHYPLFDKTNIDKINKNLVSGYINDFKNTLDQETLAQEDHKSELSIDYEIYQAPSNIISIVFNVQEDSSYMAHPIVSTDTKSYDLTKDTEVKLDDIMEGDYLKYISKLSKDYFTNHETYKDGIDSSLFHEGIYPSLENYSEYILEEDKIIFIFAKYQILSGNYGMPTMEIPYLDLKDYIKVELLEAFTKGETLISEDIDFEKPLVNINLPKRNLDPNKPMIALSFDDGPNKKTTIPILDVLKEHDSAATFFILGNRVSDNADILKRMLEEGSEIGNHSYNHKELTKLSTDGVKEQISKTQEAVMEATGVKPKLMRPTYGSFDDKLKSLVDMPLILWSVDTEDWKSRDSKKVTNHVLENVKDGDIILMHDIYESTAEATKLLVPKLIDMGYQLVTISELFESKGESLRGGEIYHQMQKK